MIKKTVSLFGLLLAASPALADDAPETRKALFGDVHVHTERSFDAYTFNVRRSADDAYRYAQGQPIRHVSGQMIQLKGGALDFYAVTDHGEYMGVVPAMNDPASPMSLLKIARELFSTTLDEAVKAFRTLIGGSVEGRVNPELDNKDIQRSAWAEAIEAANRWYRPGEFTTFIGYEYTSMPKNQNLHRIVLFKGSTGPELPFTLFDSQNPEDLWAFLGRERLKGRDAIAIPHNMNVSNGKMFEMTDWAGRPIDPDYARLRMLNEPIAEMSQIKGTSETHPLLSPNDEWAGFEIYPLLLGTTTEGKVPGSYIREAYRNGLTIEERTGANPYQFGMIGSSDTHNAGGPVDEDRYFGKLGITDGTPQARGILKGDHPQEELLSGVGRWSAAGLAGVWAEDNNRERIFAAMRRKETFATSGPRIKVRLFAGTAFQPALANATDMIRQVYATGVPMGGELKTRTAPSFLAWAQRDPGNAPLQRLQIVKGWIEDGKTKEAVYDVACASGPPDPRHRCGDSGRKPNATNCAANLRAGTPELKAVWRDPDYVAGQRAFYYVRVLEEPTCRWSTWEANRLNVAPPKSLPLLIQERAWSSPVWVKPS